METTYRGLQISAAGNAHREVTDALQRTCPPPATVLDIAAGIGALTARLRDSGYTVTANDLSPDSFIAGGECLAIDLNGDFAASFAERYDAILAVEIIEHLENTAAFLRGCAELLAPDGQLIITSPNLNSTATRAHFFRTGRLDWFAPHDIDLHGHVNPQFPWIFREHANRAGLHIAEEWCSDPSIDNDEHGRWSARLLCSRAVRRVLRRTGAGGGQIRVFVLERT